ncbi:MAG: integrase [Paracoccaceae bacterium]|jgi:integrase
MVPLDGWLSFTQQKTGGDVSIPFDRALPDFANPDDLDHLVQSLSARGDRHMTSLTTVHGSARSEKAASNWFSDACRKAGLKGADRQTAHGLRSACAIRLAEGGATPHQIGAWTSHESLKEIEEYTRGVSRKKLLSWTEARTQIVQVKKS